MLPGLKKVVIAISASATIGGALGLLIGASTENYLPWSFVVPGVGSLLGIALT